MTLDVRLIVP